MKFQTPLPLNPGDKVAIISPSSGMPFLFPWVYKQGLNRIKEIFKLVPVEFPTACQSPEYLSQNPEARAKDINEAFSDPSIKAIIATIGGIDQIRILPYLDKELISRNPKIFMGYSDCTNLHLFLWNLGITNILTESILDEGPFQMNYHLRAILFADNVVSLMGDIFVYDHLPHGWIRYEGKTYVKTNGSFKEITLNDLFPQPSQKEFLRSYCKTFLKQNGDCNYFQSPDPLRDHLDQGLIKVFVVDHESLILVFQPYAVGGFADGPFTVKIPFITLIGKWQAGNPLEKHLPITKNFLSSWDSENWISDVHEDQSQALLPTLFASFSLLNSIN